MGTEQLNEIRLAGSGENGTRRKWFNSRDMDLVVWIEDDEFVEFQLCYDRRFNEKIVTWRLKHGLTHNVVDDGESKPGKLKQSPVFAENLQLDASFVSGVFLTQTEHVDKEIVRFVLGKLVDGSELP